MRVHDVPLEQMVDSMLVCRLGTSLMRWPWDGVDSANSENHVEIALALGMTALFCFEAHCRGRCECD